MIFTIGFSPCPNDTFIFDALINKKIDTDGIEFKPVLEDIQTLNNWAAEIKLDITKLSFPAFFVNEQNYSMLQSGAALGKGVGPLLVAKKMVDLSSVKNSSVAIPGLLTTAHFLLQFSFPAIKKKIPMLFSEIEDAVVNEVTDMGVIIHENRFTYQQKGLIKVADLGEIWEERQKAPIPLACITAKKTINENLKEKINDLIRQSVEYALKNYPEITSYTKNNAQAMDEEVMRNHIELYVNNYSIELGEDGENAIAQLRSVYEVINQSSESSLQVNLPK